MVQAPSEVFLVVGESCCCDVNVESIHLSESAANQEVATLEKREDWDSYTYVGRPSFHVRPMLVRYD